jgi:hypothetical protein
MKRITALFASSALVLSLVAAPVQASDDSDKVAGALVLLGTAALLHHKNHYRDGYAPASDVETAQFENGYRDGLHNEPYLGRDASPAYMHGYDAGQRERANSLSHRTNNVAGVKIPKAAMDSCFNDAVKGVFQTNPGSVHVVKAAQEGADNFYIELAHGHKHVVCSVNSKGEIFNTEYRRL